MSTYIYLSITEGVWALIAHMHEDYYFIESFDNFKLKFQVAFVIVHVHQCIHIWVIDELEATYR